MRSRSRRGLNLLESVLAFTILGLGMVALVALMNSGFLLNRLSEKQIHAEQVLAMYLESYAQDVQTMADGAYDLPYVQDGENQYAAWMQVSTYGTDPQVKTLEVSVQYSEKGATQVHMRRRQLCDFPR